MDAVYDGEEALAFARAVMATVLIGLFLLLTKQKIPFAGLKKELLLLFFSGGAIGVNWILLFEAYRYTTVATATLCYYMAPVFVLLCAPLAGERMTLKKGVCVLLALVGMIPVSGILQEGFGGAATGTGILFGLGAAVLYAGIILLGRTLRDVSAYDKTLVQLAVVTAVLLPYSLLTETVPAGAFSWSSVGLLLIVGVVHTGIAYALYFGSMRDLPPSTVALYGYIDPIVAILLSALWLQEPFGPLEAVGAVLILCSTLLCELPAKTKT